MINQNQSYQNLLANPGSPDEYLDAFKSELTQCYLSLFQFQSNRKEREPLNAVICSEKSLKNTRIGQDVLDKKGLLTSYIICSTKRCKHRQENLLFQLDELERLSQDDLESRRQEKIKQVNQPQQDGTALASFEVHTF